MKCDCCPFECKVDRNRQFGRCKAPERFKIARMMAHFWEEPCISGSRGSGTIFFSHCNAACLFCQNYRISQLQIGRIYEDEEFIENCLEFLEASGVHNLNLVSPTHYSGRLIKVLPRLRQEINLPIVWNSNGYEKASVIEQLKDLVDVFLPDLKYIDNSLALKVSMLPDYFQYASQTIMAMHRIAPDPLFDEEGIMQKGLIIRHLILPGQVENSKNILRWLADNLGTQVHISLMAQYYPIYRAKERPELNRHLSAGEYQEVEECLLDLGFENGFLQELEANAAVYTPEF